MGKVEDMAAMRQANWAARQKAPSMPARSGPTPASEELCGHQSISKKRCIRPKDHSEANHRYAKA